MRMDLLGMLCFDKIAFSVTSGLGPCGDTRTKENKSAIIDRKQKPSPSFFPPRSDNMHLFAILPALLLAVSKHTAVTWFIDGNNVMGHKGTPRDRQGIARKVQPIVAAQQVVLVFDGQEGLEQDEITQEGIFTNVSLRQGSSADDYILEQIKALIPQRPRRKVQVVTADRALRRKVLQTKPIVYGVVNPVVFWKRYLPRLCLLKSDYTNTSEEES